MRQNSAWVTYVAGGRGVAQFAALGGGTQQATNSRAAQVFNETGHTSGKFASLEPDFWRLDGSCMLPVAAASSRLEVGYVSRDVTDAAGNFGPVNDLQISFPTPQNLDGISIVFDQTSDAVGTRVQIVCQGAQNQLLLNELVETIADENGNFSYVMRSNTSGVTGVRWLTLRFTRTSKPHRRIRVAEVYFGNAMAFNDEDILRLNTVHEADPLGRQFPLNQMTVSVANRGRFSVLPSTNNKLALLEKGSRISYAHGLAYPARGRGMLYNVYSNYNLNSWDVTNKNVTFVANSPSKVLSGGMFIGSRFELEFVGDLARRIAGEMGVRVVTNHAMDNYPRFPGFTGNVSHRQALTYLAQLYSCMLYEDKQGTIHFLDFASINQGPLREAHNFENMLAVPQISAGRRYNGISLAEHFASLDLAVLANIDFDVAGSLDVVVPYTSPIFTNPTSITVTPGFSLQNIERETMFLRARIVGNGRCAVEVRGWRVSFATTRRFYPAPWKRASEQEEPYIANLPMFIPNAVHIQSVRNWFLNRKFNFLQNFMTCKSIWQQSPNNELGDNFLTQADANGQTIRGRAFYQEMEYEGGTLSGITKKVVL